MFLLLVLLTGLGGLRAGRDPHKILVQTTVPEKISSLDTRRNPENNIVYVITIKGKPHFVHLTRQLFLSPDSVAYSYDKDGIQHSQPLLARMDCSYSGYVAGFPHSVVALMTCSGLRGIIQFTNILYEIEPLDAVSGFVHMIYEENNDNTHVPLFGENSNDTQLNDAENQVRSSLHKTEFTKLLPGYIEMYIVVDKNLFDYMGSDINAVTQKIIQLIGFVNTMLAQLKLTVVVSSIQIWSNANKIMTSGHPEVVLVRFLQWKHQHIDFKPHHISYLLVFEKRPTSIGATFPRSMCNNIYNAGIALYPAGLSLKSYAIVLVQLLGLNVGLVYDNTDLCHCMGDVCTMTPKAVYSRGLKEFSTCSLDKFKSVTSHHGLECLKNNPLDKPVYKQTKPRRICGNSIREESEECDCGTTANCTHPNCCDATLCKIKGNARCGSGECCTKNCQLKKVNTLCRPSVDKECDFDEYCNGKEADCVPNTYAHDGHTCDSGGAYCFHGICRTFDRQCQALVGGDSRGAPFACFDEINSRADPFGNCGRSFCALSHALCGKLVCRWPHKKFVSRANLSVIYTHVRDDICITAEKTVKKVVRTTMTSYQEHHDRDETFVEDGTMCGPGMYCDKWVCKEVRFIINSSCNSETHCGGNGICNNFQNCHCNKGHAPPECQKKKGTFGSIDDGHEEISENQRVGHAASSQHSFQIIFYIGIPVIIIAAALLIKQNKLRELYYRRGKEHESSASEDGSIASSSTRRGSTEH